MKTLFVVTTKDIPLNGFDLINEGSLKRLNDFVSEKFLCEYDDSSIENYLCSFKHRSLADDVRVYLNNCKNLPILKRYVGDFGIYVSLCLSEDEAGYADEISHEYVSIILEEARKDFNVHFNSAPEQIYVIAHEADLTYAKESPRFFGQEECLSPVLKTLPDGHIYIYWHEARFLLYNDFIKRLDCEDDVVKKACIDALKFFGKSLE